MFDYDNYYSNTSNKFDRIRVDGNIEVASTVQILINYIDNKANILDIGCGTGRYSLSLRNMGYDVIGIDKSYSQIEEAKKKINCSIGNIENLHFEDSFFTMCFAIMMIHQLSDNERIKGMKEIYRILKNKGNFIIKTCSHDDLLKRSGIQYFPSMYDSNVLRYPAIDILNKELCDVGFKISECFGKHTQEIMFKTQWIESLESKHNTSLAMLDENEFYKGIEKIKNDCSLKKEVIIDHHHTYIVAQKFFV